MFHSKNGNRENLNSHWSVRDKFWMEHYIKWQSVVKNVNFNRWPFNIILSSTSTGQSAQHVQCANFLAKLKGLGLNYWSCTILITNWRWKKGWARDLRPRKGHGWATVGSDFHQTVGQEIYYAVKCVKSLSVNKQISIFCSLSATNWSKKEVKRCLSTVSIGWLSFKRTFLRSLKISDLFRI